MSLQTAL